MTVRKPSSGALADDVDLVVLDVSMPRMTGLQAARELSSRKPGLRVLMLSMHENEQFLFEALRAGASGYVLKTAADRDLVEACRATMRGETFLYAGAVAALVREHLERDASSLDPLTPRELEVVKLVPKVTPATRSRACCSSAGRPSTATARTSSRSSACATASISRATRSGAG
jgi:DNA-binding NarL/FixJ family response regulator